MAEILAIHKTYTLNFSISLSLGTSLFLSQLFHTNTTNLFKNLIPLAYIMSELS